MNARVPLLFPFSLIYGAVAGIRNVLFHFNILPVSTFSTPVIGIGNLSTGGTGKTPHIEYLIRLLKNDYKIATLSRGYGRKGSGFVRAEAGHDHKKIGDEPLQYLVKFPDITVAVDNRRVRGIKKILAITPAPEIILMDDSFQHRWVKPSLNVLLTDFRNLYRDDYLLPGGNLREPIIGARRADIIIVTKTDPVFPKMLRQFIIEKMKPLPHQKLLFSTIDYGNFRPITKAASASKTQKVNTILLVSGIANPYPLEDFLGKKCENLETLKFNDHHDYTETDVKKIENTFNNIISKNKIIVTTEKDAMRLKHPEIFQFVDCLPVYSIGIEVVFHDNDKALFDEEILRCIKQSVKRSTPNALPSTAP